MSKFVEKTGKTTEEAITLALRELKISKEEAIIEVIEEPVKGLLGIGARPAVVRVSKNNDRTKVIDEFLTKVAGNMEISVKNSFEEKDGRLFVNMQGENMGLLIGYRGETLEALQNIVTVVANKNEEEFIKVELDAENYKEKRKNTLISFANKKANDAIKYNKSVTLEPMAAYERRIIHMALQENDKITTYSVGEEPYRKIVIKKV